MANERFEACRYPGYIYNRIVGYQTRVAVDAQEVWKSIHTRPTVTNAKRDAEDSPGQKAARRVQDRDISTAPSSWERREAEREAERRREEELEQERLVATAMAEVGASLRSRPSGVQGVTKPGGARTRGAAARGRPAGAE